MGVKRRIFKGLGLITKIGCHPTSQGSDIGGVGHRFFLIKSTKI
jgi:hypothetical protein